jgi:hypothetical protein
MPYTLKLDPTREKLRKEIVLPKCAKSKMDIEDPKRTRPNADTELPRRAKERQDIELPRLARLKTDNPGPTCTPVMDSPCIVPKMDSVDPTRE